MTFEFDSDLELLAMVATNCRHHRLVLLAAPIAVLATSFLYTGACAAADDYSLRLNNSAVQLINRKDYPPAISKLESALRHEPGYSIAITNLVTAYNCSFEQEPNIEPVQKVIYLLKAFLLDPSCINTQLNLSKAVASYRESFSNSFISPSNDDEKKRLAELDSKLERCTNVVPTESSSSLRKVFAGIYRLRGAESKYARQKHMARIEKERENADFLRQNIRQLQDLSKGVPPPLVRPAAQPFAALALSSKLEPTVDLRDYLVDCESKILSKWSHFNKLSNTAFAPRVALKVDRDGKISDIRLIATSGSAAVDLAALKAVERVASFKPLPDGAKDIETLEFSFNGKKGSGAWK
jgi:TonB family protein